MHISLRKPHFTPADLTCESFLFASIIRYLSNLNKPFLVMTFRIRKSSILATMLLAPFFALSQISPEGVVAVVQKQLEAYNQRNLEAFTALFHSDAALYNLGDTTPIAAGLEAITQLYARLFERSPNLRSDVVSRQVIGNKVLDYEIISGRAGSPEPVYLIAVYEIEGAKIKRCFFIRP
jgi:hypothetical protein